MNSKLIKPDIAKIRSVQKLYAFRYRSFFNLMKLLIKNVKRQGHFLIALLNKVKLLNYLHYIIYFYNEN